MVMEELKIHGQFAYMQLDLVKAKKPKNNRVIFPQHFVLYLVSLLSIPNQL